MRYHDEGFDCIWITCNTFSGPPFCLITGNKMIKILATTLDRRFASGAICGSWVSCPADSAPSTSQLDNFLLSLISWKHPGDTSRGCAFLSESVPHHSVRFLRRQWLLVDIIDHPLTSPLHSRLRIPTSFLPTYPPLTIGRVGPFEKGVHPPASSSALRPGDWLIPRAISTPQNTTTVNIPMKAVSTMTTDGIFLDSKFEQVVTQYKWNPLIQLYFLFFPCKR